MIGALGYSISYNFRRNWGPKVLVWISAVSRRQKANHLGTATLNSNKISGHWKLGWAFVVTRHTLWPGGGSTWLHGQNGTRNPMCSFFPALSSSPLGWLKFIYFCYNKTWPEYSAFLSPVWIYWNTKVFVGEPQICSLWWDVWKGLHVPKYAVSVGSQGDLVGTLPRDFEVSRTHNNSNMLIYQIFLGKQAKQLFWWKAFRVVEWIKVQGRTSENAFWRKTCLMTEPGPTLLWLVCSCYLSLWAWVSQSLAKRLCDGLAWELPEKGAWSHTCKAQGTQQTLYIATVAVVTIAYGFVGGTILVFSYLHFY